MSDVLLDTPDLSRSYCPGCEPEADPLTAILTVRWCGTHMPDHAGLDDGRIADTGYLSGSAEVEGATNQGWCNLVHRARVRSRP